MNVSDAMDTKANFCTTPGWASMRFARPLVAGERYKNYVKMIPTVENPDIYLGDVYVLQGGEIIGFVGGIKFRRYPRLLLNLFFSAPDDGGPGTKAGAANRAPAAVAKPPAVHAPVQADLKPKAIPQSVLPKESQSSKVAEPLPQAPTIEPDANVTPTID